MHKTVIIERLVGKYIFDIEIVREWIEKADEDFDFALVNFKEKKSFFAQICFHFQQSAEKYLKAYIIAQALQFQKIHDLLCSSKYARQRILHLSD